MSHMSAVVLAGGEGKRMMSDKPKALCEVLGKPMLKWVLDSLKASGIDDICVVTGHKKEYIEDYLKGLPFPVETAFQSERLGTGHAVMMASNFLKKHPGDVVILGADAPFMDSDTICKAHELHISAKASATVISARVDDPFGYGRIVKDENGALEAIVEQKDANEEIAKISEVNSGAYWFDCEDLLSVLFEIGNKNASGEYYLPDALRLLISKGKAVRSFTAESPDTVLGANDPNQLRELNEIAKKRHQK